MTELPPHVEPVDPNKVNHVHRRVSRAWRLRTVGMRLSFNTWQDNYTGETVHLLVYPMPNIFKVDWFPYKPGTPLSEIAEPLSTDEMRRIDPGTIA